MLRYVICVSALALVSLDSTQQQKECFSATRNHSYKIISCFFLHTTTDHHEEEEEKENFSVFF